MSDFKMRSALNAITLYTKNNTNTKPKKTKKKGNTQLTLNTEKITSIYL